MNTLTRKESEPDIVMAGLSLRLTAEQKDALDDLARSARMDTSEVLIILIQGVINANKERIENYRKLSSPPLIF